MKGATSIAPPYQDYFYQESMGDMGLVGGFPFKARDLLSTGTEIGGMACRKRASLGSYIADSDPESQPDHPTTSGGLLEYSAKGLEQLRQVMTEIIEGTEAAEQLVQEEEEEELVDDGDDKNEATL